MSPSRQRPDIASIKSADELRRWYWLKSELAAEARRLKLKVSGAKFTLLERLCHFHETGERHWPGDKPAKAASTFDWRSAPLSHDTLITDNYRNTQNVRQYFIQHIDPAFKFNIALMDWMRDNVGNTLGEAGDFWLQHQALATESVIKPHNQFNRYARDFIADNPELGMREARRFWALKRALPSDSGRHFYERSDLDLTDEQ
jgi:hypothetical protein